MEKLERKLRGYEEKLAKLEQEHERKEVSDDEYQSLRQRYEREISEARAKLGR